MTELARSLRRELAGEFPHGNPLVAIGVSAQVLDLGLTEDELFDYITRDVARRLVLRFHTDGRDFTDRPEVATLRGRLSEVYRQLQDREMYNRAMADFRNMKSEERSETRLLRLSLAQTRDQLDRYRKKELSLSKGAEKMRLRQEKLLAKETLYAQAIDKAADLEEESEKLYSQLAASQKRASYESKRYGDLLRYVSHLGYQKNDLGLYAFEAKWVVVAALVPKWADAPLPDNSGTWKEEFLEFLQPLQIPPESLKGILTRWKWWSNFMKDHEHAKLRLHVFTLSAANMEVLYGWDHFDKLGRVIGSVSPRSLDIVKKHLSYRLAYDLLFEHLVPFLGAGGLLVSEKMTERKLLKGKKIVPTVGRETRMIILGAG